MTRPRSRTRPTALQRGVVLLTVAAALAAPSAQAADEAQLARVAADEQIDRATGAFDDPLLARLRASVSPSWPGPLGAPPETQRTICPLVPQGGLPTTNLPFRRYPFC